MATALAPTTHYDARAPRAPAVEIEGLRLNLRPWHQRHDRRSAATWPPARHPFTRLWSTQSPPMTQTRRRYSWAIDERTRGQLIGRVSLRDITFREARLGIYLRDDYHGQGYGREALHLFLALCFDRLGFTCIKLDVAASNTHAHHLYTSQGFMTYRQDWRTISDDPAVALLATAEYEHLRPYFQLARAPYTALFFEMQRRPIC
ncbi:MAG: GNAT family N-acetyltransferase [Blastochloris sp.]|nr:GNAT family N-acetyltransferase [Blastochloris sp.]